MRAYTVVLVPDAETPGAFNVTVPALPGCNTWGQGRSEALDNAREAITLYLEQLEAEGRPGPAEAETAVVQV
jgi:antitoxin HicB